MDSSLLLAGLQIAKLVKSQLRTVADERKALIAEERQNLEKLLVAISGSINRDLPLRIEDILKREVATVATQVGASVGAALSEALPRELAGGSLQVSFERVIESRVKYNQRCDIIAQHANSAHNAPGNCFTLWLTKNLQAEDGCLTTSI